MASPLRGSTAQPACDSTRGSVERAGLRVVVGAPPRSKRLSHEAELVAHAVPSCTRRVMITRLGR